MDFVHITIDFEWENHHVHGISVTVTVVVVVIVIISRRAEIIRFLFARVYIVCVFAVRCTLCAYTASFVYSRYCVCCGTKTASFAYSVAHSFAALLPRTHTSWFYVYIFGVDCCVYEGNVVGGTPHDSNANQMNSVQV